MKTVAPFQHHFPILHAVLPHSNNSRDIKIVKIAILLFTGVIPLPALALLIDSSFHVYNVLVSKDFYVNHWRKILLGLTLGLYVLLPPISPLFAITRKVVVLCGGAIQFITNFSRICALRHVFSKNFYLRLKVKVILWALVFFQKRLESGNINPSKIIDWFLAKRRVRNLGCYGLGEIEKILSRFFDFVPEKKGCLPFLPYWRPRIYLARKEIEIAKRLCSSSFSFTTSSPLVSSLAQKLVVHGLRQGAALAREFYDHIR
jgi:hypothetical protein